MNIIYKITILLNLVGLSLVAQSTILNEKIIPFNHIDFKTNKWILVFDNIIDPDSLVLGFSSLNEKTFIINDEQILDSLKSDFKYILDKRIDNNFSPENFTISLYKNNTFFNRYKFDSKDDFEFGEFARYFQPINKKKKIVNLSKLNQQKKKPLRNEIDFYYSSQFDTLSDFTFKIEIGFNINDSNNFDIKKVATMFIKNNPKLKNKNINFIYGRTFNHGIKNDYESCTIGFPCSSEFTIDPESLNKHNTKITHKIIGIEPTEYYLTILKK